MGSRDADVGDKEQVSKRKTKLELAREREVANLHKMLGSYEGREFVYRLLAQCRMFASSFVPGDPHGTSWNEGKREMGLWAYAEVFTARPEAYNLMVSEANQRERALGA